MDANKTGIDFGNKVERVKTLSVLSREELSEKVISLEAQVFQLKNIIGKLSSGNNKSSANSAKHAKARIFDFERYNVRHVALKLAYLGWDYHGYAAQVETSKTIEAVLFEALTKAKLIEKRETSCYHRCGRTDKGVSAFSQVVSIDLRTNLLEGKGVKPRENGKASERPGDKETEIDYVHILNKLLPPDVRVLAWCPVQPEFSARFSCKGRTYKYFMPRGNMDLSLMHEAGQLLLGEHDFRNMCKMDVGNGVVNYKRSISLVDISLLGSKTDDGADSCYEMCVLTVKGAAFLWHQIRCIVSLLVLIGQGLEQPQIISQLLDVANCPEKPQYTMASELPLVLYNCEFEDIDWIYEPDSLKEVTQHFQSIWMKHAVSTAMVLSMLKDLEAQTVAVTGTLPGHDFADCLVPGNKPRLYKRLMDRQTCEGLESRLRHYNKKRKLEDANVTSSATS